MRSGFCLLPSTTSSSTPSATFPGRWSTGPPACPGRGNFWSGRHPYYIHELHKRYGHVVRTAPNEISFISPTAWRDIYGHRVGTAAGVVEISKYEPILQAKRALAVLHPQCARDLHATLRRGLAHGFSERSMRNQETIIGGYVNLLISRLRDKTANGDAANIVQWYNFTTFDIIGDLSVGRSFGCLDHSEYSSLVQLFEDSPKQTLSVLA